MDERSKDPRLAADRDLLARLKVALPSLREVRDRFGMEDGVYRFWYQSFKVFHLQEVTKTIAEALQAVAPDRPLSPWFFELVADGTERRFRGPETNANWLAETRPIVEAWFHADHMLRSAIACAERIEDVSPMLPYDWATILCLYQQR